MGVKCPTCGKTLTLVAPLRDNESIRCAPNAGTLPQHWLTTVFGAGHSSTVGLAER